MTMEDNLMWVTGDAVAEMRALIGASAHQVHVSRLLPIRYITP